VDRWKENNREKIRQYNKERYRRKREEILRINAEYRRNNPEKKRELTHNYRINNLSYMAAKEAKRRALKLKATPAWLTEEHWKQIQAVYEEARLLGFHVDHIIPLKNKIVCGLHVPWNLQPLPPKENMKKHNSFDIGE
jgi:hypothetical protein